MAGVAIWSLGVKLRISLRIFAFLILLIAPVGSLCIVVGSGIMESDNFVAHVMQNATAITLEVTIIVIFYLVLISLWLGRYVEIAQSTREKLTCPNCMKNAVRAIAQLIADVQKSDMLWNVSNPIAARIQQNNSEYRYSLLAQNIKDIIWMLDMDLRYQYISHSCLQFHGYSSEDMMGFNLQSVLTPASFEHVKAYLAQEVARDGLPGIDPNRALTFELEYICSDGSPKWGEVTVSAVREANGTPIGLTGATRNITERRNMEAALRRRDAMLEAVATAGERFMRTGKWEDAIDEVLATLGSATEADRAYIFRNGQDAEGVECMYSVYRWIGTEDIDTPDDSVLAKIPWHLAQRWYDAMSQGRAIAGTVSSFSEDEKVLFEPRGTKSVATAPIFVGDEWWGFMGMDLCRHKREWSQPELESLRLAAHVLGLHIQQQRIEQARRNNERQYEELVESARSVILRLDCEGHITFFNKFAQQLFGYSAEEIIGRHVVGTIVPEFDASGHNLVEMISSLCENPAEFANNENETTTKDGTRLWLAWTNRALLNDENEITGILCIGNDTTSRKQMEEQLREGAEQLAQKVNALNCLYGISRLIETTGMSTAELLQGIVDLIPVALRRPDNTWGLLQMGNEVYTTSNYIGKLPEIVVYIKVHGERVGSVEIGHVTPQTPALEPAFSSEEVQLLYAVVERVGRIIEHRQSEEQLQAAMKELQRSNVELEQFAYIASHDLKEPLRSVATATQLLAWNYQSKLDDDADELIGAAIDGAKRMEQLISDLLQYSRVGRADRAFKPVSLQNVYTEAVTNIGQMVAEYDATITADELPIVVADESQMGQLFQNLIVNGIKFHSDKMPQVHVGVAEETGYWHFTVTDNGIGIDKRYHDRIFQIFQRLQDVEQPGTGIGLAICRKIVERHGGSIWVESEIDKGTVFHFTIPYPTHPVQGPT